ncbi:glycosyltransferase [Pseudonocardia acidicola]|uniref:Glycosyltransferase n=1 Tax=Pseudonocardia acidicola TaxID=2724939 RepID=A0ABX1SEU3_9PSEU|nr:glycosyltransferase [Pseudonocardia acidicola]NMI00087.1 glycosyltransferase [Pseudonocardia acidicola]
MRVLHVITGLAAGGAEQQLRMLVARSEVEAEVACLTNPGIVADAIRADGVAVHHLGMRGNTDLAVLPRLASLIRRGRFDVVHTHLYRACLYGRVAARLAGVRSIVATEHSLGARLLEGRDPGRPGVRELYLATERLGAVTIAVSRAVADRLAGWGVPEHRLVVVPNGIDAHAFAFDPEARRRVRAAHGIAEHTPVVGAVGRLDRGKHFDLLLRALAEVPDAVLLLVGEGPQREPLTALAAQLGITERVRFTGESAAVPTLLSAMDAFASPSESETFGLAVIEALAAGLPVAYASCPALAELPSSAAPQAHAIEPDTQALRAALQTMLVAGRRHEPPSAVTRHDIAEVARTIDRIYERTAGGEQVAATATQEGGRHG